MVDSYLIQSDRLNALFVIEAILQFQLGQISRDCFFYKICSALCFLSKGT